MNPAVAENAKDFTFPEVDADGMETLDAISVADRFNRWMYDCIAPHTSGRILEIGSGTGNISQFFVAENADITLSDIRANYVSALQQKFAGRDVLHMDLVDPDFDAKFAAQRDYFDTIFALNVVEHIEDDGLALRNAYKMLRPGGRVVILVPAYQALYNSFDKALEHFRRYNRKRLTSLISNSGFEITHSQYFNFTGIFGWILSGGILRKKTIPKGQMKVFERLMPVIKLLDKVVMNRVGLSVVAVGRKG